MNKCLAQSNKSRAGCEATKTKKRYRLRLRSGEPGKRAFDPPINEDAMKFLGTTTVIAPIVLIILTLWLGLAFASPADAALTSSDATQSSQSRH
jgi:hypothetical protein